MIAIRSHFAPDNIEGVQVGDTVFFHVTNIEQDWDILHGFAVLGNNNSELILQPGETRTLTWIPKSPGVFPFYCTDFCSALHQEMQGYIRVSPAGSSVKLDGEREQEGASAVGPTAPKEERSDVEALDDSSSLLASALVLVALVDAALANPAAGAAVPGRTRDGHSRRARVRGATEHDLQSINSLNHYIGMKAIEPEEIAELRVIPWVHRRPRGGRARRRRDGTPLRCAIGWLASFARPRCRRLCDFYHWEYEYGHDLDLAHAIIKVPGHDLPAAAHRVEATVELHGELVADDRRHSHRSRVRGRMPSVYLARPRATVEVAARCA